MSLHDLLEDLAAEAPLTGAPPHELWRRGRRIARARRIGTVVIAVAACLGLLALAGLSWQSRSTSLPADQSGHAPAMPDRLYTQPSGWLPTYHGAPGTLAAIVQGTHNTLFGSQPAVIGVSATSGRYAFLPLPHLTRPESAVLAPDGRHIGYWITGTPSDRAIGRFDNGAPAVVGFAVYDATTSRSRMTRIKTHHGLYPQDLAWSDDSHLYARYSGITSPNMATGQYLRVTGLTGMTPRGHAILARQGGYPVGYGRVLVNRAPRHSAQLLEVRWGRLKSVAIGAFMPTPAVSPNGALIAVVTGDTSPARMTIQHLDGRVLGETGDVVATPLAWIDDRHLAVVKPATPASDLDPRRGTLEILELSDAGTIARRETAVRDFPGTNGYPQSYAVELLARPTVPAPRPPSPLGLRMGLGFGLAIVSAGALGLVLWRRRVRP